MMSHMSGKANQKKRLLLIDGHSMAYRAFFALLQYLFITTPDAEGWPMASVLTGSPGFIASPDPTTLRIDALTVGGTRQ